MKKYIKPELLIEQVKTDDIIAASYTENGSDNNTDWLENWASVLNS